MLRRVLKVNKDKIEKSKFFQEYLKFVKKSGGCEQCQYPWNDGLCECEFGKTHSELTNGMLSLEFECNKNPV
jgi:hypothetical protein